MIIYLATLRRRVGAVSLEPESANSTNGFVQELEDPQELEAFINGVIAAQLRAYHIPGASVSVVKEGESFTVPVLGAPLLENCWADALLRTHVGCCRLLVVAQSLELAVLCTRASLLRQPDPRLGTDHG